MIDLTQEGRDLASFEPDFFDAVLCMGVIEHVSDTPKPLLLALNRVLRSEGTLVLDTPNLLYSTRASGSRKEGRSSRRLNFNSMSSPRSRATIANTPRAKSDTC